MICLICIDFYKLYDRPHNYLRWLELYNNKTHKYIIINYSDIY